MRMRERNAFKNAFKLVLRRSELKAGQIPEQRTEKSLKTFKNVFTANLRACAL